MSGWRGVELTRTSLGIVILMTHHDCADYLCEAVASLLRGQSHRDFRLVLLDDATPSDRWQHRLRDFSADSRLEIYRSAENVGTYRLLNCALDMTDEPLIAIHDADDVSAPERLSLQAEALQRRPDVAMIGSSFDYVSSDGSFLRRKHMPRNVNLFDRLGRRFTILHSTILFRRAILADLRGYDGTRRTGADQDLFMRAALKFRIRNLPESLFSYRMRPGQLTATPGICLNSKDKQRYAEDIRRRRADLLRQRPALRDLRAPRNDCPVSLERLK